MESKDVMKFWFEELKPQQWFIKDEALDTQIRERFLSTHQKAAIGELSHWRSSAFGRLAEIIVLDQFSRNIFRDKKEAFAYDPLALILAQESIRSGVDQDLAAQKRSFLYMPFMHSESPLMHKEAVGLFSGPGMENNLQFELKHKKIIDRFGRYPHRNAILGRESTLEEIEFLKEPNSSF